MVMHRDHELHVRRRGRNVGVLLALLAMIGVVFGLTVVKVRTGGLAAAIEQGMRSAPVSPEAFPAPTAPDAATETRP